MPNCPDYLPAFHGVIRSGAAVSPVNATTATRTCAAAAGNGCAAGSWPTWRSQRRPPPRPRPAERERRGRGRRPTSGGAGLGRRVGHPCRTRRRSIDPLTHVACSPFSSASPACRSLSSSRTATRGQHAACPPGCWSRWATTLARGVSAVQPHLRADNQPPQPRPLPARHAVHDGRLRSDPVPHHHHRAPASDPLRRAARGGGVPGYTRPSLQADTSSLKLIAGGTRRSGRRCRRAGSASGGAGLRHGAPRPWVCR